MPPKNSRRGQYRRAEEVFVAGDANNDAFKAPTVNSKKRSIKAQPSVESSDDETPEPSRKSHPSKFKLFIPLFRN